MIDSTAAVPTYTAKLIVWSSIGHTPVTGRGGSFCDVLAEREVEVTGPVQAREALEALRSETPYSRSGHFYLPEYPNQNTRAGHVAF